MRCVSFQIVLALNWNWEFFEIVRTTEVKCSLLSHNLPDRKKSAISAI